jgi:hypothetical protein
MVVPNQDQLVLEGAKQRRAAERSRTTAAQLDSGPETPALDLLRQHVAPPAPAVAAAAAPAPVAPSNPPSAVASAATPSTVGDPAPALAPPVAIAVTTSVAAPASGAALPGPVAGGRSYAQFAALNSEEAARAEWDRLLRRVPELSAFQPRITRLEREGQPTLWRLRAAGLPDAAAAKALCDAVRARGVACLPSGA